VQYHTLIDTHIRAVLEDLAMPAMLREPFIYIMSSSGKRLRPLLTLLACEAVGGKAEDALHAGTAIEILHNFTLVHDDIMDKSPIRRGNPTVHIKWDEPTAILAGDVMMGYAYRTLSMNTPAALLPAALREFNRGFIEVCEGQALDLEYRYRNDINTGDYLRMIGMKTACLLEIAVSTGAILGTADGQALTSLTTFAHALGTAFQLQDDLLDVTATEEELGKSIGQDIVEGKKTYMIIRCYELTRSLHATDPKRMLIDRFYAQHGLPALDIPDVVAMMNELGVTKETEGLITENFSTARSALRVLPQSDARTLLDAVITLLDKRKR
ncbi:MAG: polyprenyl synthetase family protein, partial [Candidatus Kapabacteria bacterium]|nr:polyprenyl synthetase family protein [Candidatus Kapabacteria bacterium]